MNERIDELIRAVVYNLYDDAAEGAMQEYVRYDWARHYDQLTGNKVAEPEARTEDAKESA